MLQGIEYRYLTQEVETSARFYYRGDSTGVVCGDHARLGMRSSLELKVWAMVEAEFDSGHVGEGFDPNESL